MDIQLRFHKDMLVLSAPIAAALRRAGLDTARDLEFTLLFEPDVVEEAYRLESIAGAQCLVAATDGVTPARLAVASMDGRGQDVVDAALEVVRAFRPQHVLAALGPCGLPLDSSSKASMTENRDQYARAARLFDGREVDGFLLEGFASCVDLMCALAGLDIVALTDHNTCGNCAAFCRAAEARFQTAAGLMLGRGLIADPALIDNEDAV